MFISFWILVFIFAIILIVLLARIIYNVFTFTNGLLDDKTSYDDYIEVTENKNYEKEEVN